MRTAAEEQLASRAAPPPLSVSYVCAETYTALLARVGRREAIEWGRRFRAGSAHFAQRGLRLVPQLAETSPDLA